jgi:hypothetical protein
MLHRTIVQNTRRDLGVLPCSPMRRESFISARSTAAAPPAHGTSAFPGLTVIASLASLDHETAAPSFNTAISGFAASVNRHFVGLEQ